MEPTLEQLALINRFTPVGLPNLTPEEVITIPFVATDNLLTRSLGKWAADDLVTLARLLPGLPFTLDHDWGDVAKSQGLVYNTRVVKTDSAPDEIVSAAGNYDSNSQIIKKEGYIVCECDVAFPNTSAIVSALKFGMLGKVSLGGFVYKDTICPLCETSFLDKHCPHFLPEPFWSEPNDIDEKIAPYFIRSGVYDLGELSLVLIPNIPGAGVVRKN
ncbi:MAG: hypothetical protein WBB28_09450 [Crinalium sp.]